VSCSVHDLAHIESVGIPAVLATTTEFADAVAAQADALGSDPRHVLVAHPIQNRTDAEVRLLADGALDPILHALCDAG
jgi:hypothetical protein